MRDYHRPQLPGDALFSAIEDEATAKAAAEAAADAAAVLVRGAQASRDPGVAERILHLADTEGLDEIAEVWSHAAPGSLAGCLWRLYVLRTWVHTDPETAAREFEAGRAHAPLARVVSGVAEPPGPEELKRMVDELLTGIATSAFADVLFRAAAFARVVAHGRSALATNAPRAATSSSAARLLHMAEQLESAAHAELRHPLV